MKDLREAWKSEDGLPITRDLIVCQVWYATNIEIYNYVKAQRMLKISYNENMFYNSSAIDVWVEKDKELIIKIPAGEMVIL